jgi:hypothetical protein
LKVKREPTAAVTGRNQLARPKHIYGMRPLAVVWQLAIDEGELLILKRRVEPEGGRRIDRILKRG